MIILALDTSREACSVAVASDGHIVSSMTLVRPRSHAERLVPMIVEALRRAGLSIQSVGAVAVAAGPGSYTGLRIGVSTAKGLCFSHGATLIGVPTLDAYSRTIRAAARLDGWVPEAIAVALRSRRNEVYFGTSDASQNDISPRLLSYAEAARWIDEQPATRIALGGDGSTEILQLTRSENATRVLFVPTATGVADAGREALLRGEEDDLDTFEPYYLKDYIAKRPVGTIFDRLQF